MSKTHYAVVDRIGTSGVGRDRCVSVHHTRKTAERKLGDYDRRMSDATDQRTGWSIIPVPAGTRKGDVAPFDLPDRFDEIVTLARACGYSSVPGQPKLGVGRYDYPRSATVAVKMPNRWYVEWRRDETTWAVYDVRRLSASPELGWTLDDVVEDLASAVDETS